MFGLFAPRPPLEVQEQAWIERRLNALARELGPQRLGLGDGSPVEQLRPSEELTGVKTAEHAEDLFARIVEKLRPAGDVPSIAWFDGDAHLATDRNAVPVPRSGLSDPVTLAAALVRGACRRMHFGEGDANLRDVDLVATSLGAGLFLANIDAPAAAPADPALRGLTSREIGYALALLWHVRQEEDGSKAAPPWLSELRGDAAGAVAGGLKYLRKVGDARFHAGSYRENAEPTQAQIRDELHHRRPARRLAATWEAAGLRTGESQTPRTETATLSALLETLHDREPAVRSGACVAVARLCPEAETDRELWDRCLLGLVAATDDPIAAVRASALAGAASLPDLPAGGGGREELDRVTLAGLGSRTPAVRQAAAALAAALPPVEPGAKEAPFAPAVLKALVGSLVRCADAEAAENAATLKQLHPDPAALAEERVEDDELLARVLDALGVASLGEPDHEPASAAAEA